MEIINGNFQGVCQKLRKKGLIWQIYEQNKSFQVQSKKEYTLENFAC